MRGKKGGPVKGHRLRAVGSGQEGPREKKWTREEISAQARINGKLGGRPPSINPKLEEAILMALRQGAFPSAAAEASGVPRQTFSDWMRRGAQQRRGVYHELYVKVMAAMSEGELRALEQVQAAAEKDWKAAAWLLERRFRARWARQVETPAEGPSENQTSLHAHQHLHINFDTIETPVLEFIQRHRTEFGKDPTKDLFFNKFSREPSPEEAKLLSEAKPTPLDPTETI